ncbi:MAG: sensor domain-containing diguanylate cyclase [Acetobacteraceae bacterium]|nr:sensor domain-containing diguanylate cyclase [Acetobacteraceae bacterium]
MLHANDWLRLRLIAVVVCLLVAGFGITNVISYNNAAAILKSTILHNELPLTGSNIYSEVQADLIRPVFVSSVMANDTFLKDWLLGGEKDPEQVVRYLDAIRAKYGVFTSFVVSDATRRYYHFRGGERVVSSDSADDVWYFRDRSMTAPYEINIDYDESSNRTVTIFVNYRLVGYDGRFLGITGVGLNIESVRNIVERYHNNFQRNVYFLTRAGEVTVTSDGGPKTGETIATLPGISTIASRILGSSEGQYEYIRDGETYLLDTRFIPELGWYVVVEQRQADAMAGLWHGFITNLWIGFAIILVTATVVAWVVTLYHRRLSLLATTDKLTGLANRQAFDDTMLRLERSGRRTSRPFAVLLLDIDLFKRINDTLGHLRGDEVIRSVAQHTVATLRRTDFVCRWGGEELIVVAYDCDLDEAVRLAETLRAGIEMAPLRTPDDGTRVTVSIGITAWRTDDTIDRILARVDRALYQAKRDGRNCVRVATPPTFPAEAAA